MKRLLNLKGILAIVLGVVLLASCMRNEEPAPLPPSAILAVINTYSPITATQFRFSDGRSVNLPYSQGLQINFTSLTDLTLTAINQATNQVLVDRAPLSLELEKFYSAYLFGNAVPAKFILLNDVPIESTQNNPRIRFLNLGEGVEAVDLFLGTEKIEMLSNRDPEIQANAAISERYILSTINAGANDISIRSLDGTLLAELLAFNFISRGFHTITLSGDRASTGDTAEARARALKVSVF